MQLFNTTGLFLGAVPSVALSPAHALTVVVKGTFKLEHGGAAVIAPPAERQLLSGDVHHDDDSSLGLRYPSDFAPFKPRGDVLLVGTCHAPGDKPVAMTHAVMHVGELRKRIAVIGDRRWVGEGTDRQATAPVPFRSMPLRYDRSFGGPNHPKNPIGRGEVASLPNLEFPGRMLTAPNQMPDPAGFGPLGPTWARVDRIGTYDEAWRTQRWPGFPEDFDWAYFNASPADQQIEGYLRGDEAIVLENLHAGHRHFESRLPGIRPRCLVGQRASSAPLKRYEALADHEDGCAIREVVLRLDTLWLDIDAGQLCLVWRGIYPTLTRDGGEVAKALLVTESLADAPVPARVYADASFWQVPEQPLSTGPSKEASAPSASEEAGDVEAEVKAEIEQTRAMLEKARAPKEMLDRIAGVRTRDELNAALLAGLVEDPVTAARVAAECRERLRDTLTQAGLDPAAFDEPGETPAPAWSREHVEAHAARKGSFLGAKLAGLDLAGLDLRRLAFAGADMRGTRLDHAKLDGADLTGARLSKASLLQASMQDAIAEHADFFEATLTGADLSRASLGASGLRAAALLGTNLSEADLTGAVLAQSNLQDAILEGAELARADLSGADLRRARAGKALLPKATLVGADLRGAVLDTADLSGCVLDGSKLDDASLQSACLDGASCTGASMLRAKLMRSSAEGAVFKKACLRGAIADGCNWSAAMFHDADLREASLIRANLTAVDMANADLRRAIAKHAILTKANLKGARVRFVNLFQSSLEGADLSDADCSDSNLYGCELLDAKLQDTRLERTNVKATKLVTVPA